MTFYDKNAQQRISQDVSHHQVPYDYIYDKDGLVHKARNICLLSFKENKQKNLKKQTNNNTTQPLRNSVSTNHRGALRERAQRDGNKSKFRHRTPEIETTDKSEIKAKCGVKIRLGDYLGKGNLLHA